MISHTLLSLVLFITSVLLYRYSFPYPFQEYLSLFIPLFIAGFIPNFLYRRWGRIFTVCFAIIFVRYGAITSSLVTIPEWTSLHPLFWGAILGILSREHFLIFMGRGKQVADLSDKDPLRRRMSLNPSPGQKLKYWMEPDIWIVFFISILVIERVLHYFPWSFQTGINFSDGFYIQGLSYREAFGLTWMYWDNLIPVIWYIFTEERCSGDADNPNKHWIIGLAIGFLIQAIIILEQTFLNPSLLMQATGESIKVGRVAGLWRDSGSASWIIPTLGLYLVWKIWEKRGTWRESSRRILITVVLVSTALLGIKLGKTFWLTYGVGSFGFLIYFVLRKIQHPNQWLQSLLRAFAILILIGFGFSLVWFGENQKIVPALSNSSIILKKYISGKDLEELDYRSNLMNASLDLWKDSKFFGNGFGSMIVHLKDSNSPIKHRPPNNFVDSPANFYLGWLGETGLLGCFLLSMYVFLKTYIAQNKRYLLLLVIPLMTGYQITHADGAFIVFFLIAGSRRIENSRSKLLKNVELLKTIWVVVAVGISLHYLAFAILSHS
ncbi:MAG: hypothetical protein GW761_02795 [Leptospira sp.]|nr:hypothetical protein [Leptospira sp.]